MKRERERVREREREREREIERERHQEESADILRKFVDTKINNFPPTLVDCPQTLTPMSQ